MGEMGKDDSLIDSPKHVPLIVIGGQPHKSPLCQRIFIGPIEKREKNQAAVMRFNGSDLPVGQFIYGLALGLYLRPLPAKQPMEEPLQISRRGGAAFALELSKATIN